MSKPVRHWTVSQISRGSAVRRRRTRSTTWLGVAFIAALSLVGCDDNKPGSGNGATADAGSVDAQKDGGASADCTKPSDCSGELASCRQWTCSQGACLAVGTPNGAVCHDGDLCSPGLCEQGDCKSSPKVCPPASAACRVNACEGSTGACKEGPAADGASCDDGQACSKKDTCQGGVCKAGPGTCECASDKDCPDDDDLCNGVPYCNAAAGTCEPNPATVVVCPTAKDTACVHNTCSPKTGSCAMASLPDKTPCDDGEACTKGDVCQAGACTAGTDICPCQADSDCKDDGDACNGLPFCNLATGKCETNPATVVVCPNAGDTACKANVCDAKTGACSLQPVSEGKACDDDNPCTPDETCSKGACSSKTNACACATDADCVAKDDGNLCNGTLFCDQVTKSCVPNPATTVSCQTVDNTACSAAKCAPKTGVCSQVPLPDTAPCDDGNACTTGDACAKGVCTPAATAAQCLCTADADCAKFEDGDLCNGTLVCDKAKKQCIVAPKTTVLCPSGNDTQCAHNTCDKKSGKCAMTPAPVNTACDDKQPCTVADRCGPGGQCKPGNDVCECGPHKPKVDCEATKGDGDACNGTLWCDTAALPFTCAPKPKSAVTCKTVDNSFCQANVCDPKTGVCALKPVAANVAKPCDDGDPCSLNTACQGGACKGGTNKDCDDKEPCTQDACTKASDCTYTPLSGGTCDDGKPCTGPDSCSKGACGGPPKTCDDSNVCTADTCDDAKPGGCVNTPATAPCSDGDACTANDSCKDGKCVGSGKPSCDDGNSCTVDACDPATGACSSKATSGAACTLIGSVAGTCAAGVCKAKAPCVLFTRELAYEGAANSAFEHVVTLAAGGHAAAGRERTKTGMWTPVVTRLDESGAPLWSWRETGKQTGEAVASAVVDVSDGGPLDDTQAAVLAVGLSRVDLTPLGAVWRLSATGQLVDKTTFGGSGNDRLRDAAPFADGLVMTGDTSTQSNGKTDCWILRTQGAKPKAVWDVRFGGGSAESCFAVATQGNSVLAVGSTEAVGSGVDAYAVLVNDAGKLQWKKSYGGKGTQRFYAVTPLSSGRWLAGGASIDGVEASYLARLDATGAVEATAYPKELEEVSGLHAHGSGAISALGQHAPWVTGGSGGLSVRATVLARLTPELKVSWSTSLLGTAAVKVQSKLQVAGDRYLFAGARHTDVDGDAKKELQALAMATDAWGHATCASAGACAVPAYRYCDDGEPCTTDTCAAVSGCAHKAVAGCSAAHTSADLDYDGLAGGTDPCPSVWNPDGDKTLCLTAGAAAGTQRAVTLTAPGSAPGHSGQRRTHEVLEVALANGLADDSALAAWWRFDSNTLDASSHKRHLTAADGTYALGRFATQGKAFRARGPKNGSSKIADLVANDFTLALWARAVPDQASASCTLVSASGDVSSLTTEGHLSLTVDDDRALRTRFGTHDGSYKGPGLAGVRTEDGVVTAPATWHHYALVSRQGQPLVVYVDGVSLATKSDGGDNVAAGYPVGLKYLKFGDGSVDCTVTVDDALLFTRPLAAQEISALAQSAAPYRTQMLVTKSPDFAGVRVVEQRPWDAAPHYVPSEVVGKRPLGPADLKSALGYWRFDGNGNNEVSGKNNASLVGVTWVPGGFANADKAAAFNGKTSYATVTDSAAKVSDFTVEAWFRVTPPTHKRMYLLDTRASKQATKSGVALIVDTLASANLYRLVHLVSDGGKDYSGSFETHLDAGWHHTALRRKGGKLTLFLDGVAVPAKWSNGDTVSTELSLFGGKPLRIGYFGGGTLGADFKAYALSGAIDEVAIHAAAVSDDALARRVAGPPRVRFFASTGAGVAAEGYVYHRYALRDDGGSAQVPTLTALDQKTTCAGLLSPCFGVAAWWRFDGYGTPVLDSSTSRNNGVLVGGGKQQGGAAVFAQASELAQVGSWATPFTAGDYTVEWRGEVAAFEPGATAADLVWRAGDAPSLAAAKGQWVFGLSSTATVSGGKFALATPHALAGVYQASKKLAALFVDGVSVGSAGGITQSSTPAKELHIGKGSAAAGHIGRVSDVRVMSRALAPDELQRYPATTYTPAP